MRAWKNGRACARKKNGPSTISVGRVNGNLESDLAGNPASNPAGNPGCRARGEKRRKSRAEGALRAA